jgi:hypothetical protein
MRRSRLQLALVLSLVLHAALALWMRSVPARELVAPPPPVELAWVEVDPPPPPEPSAEPARAPSTPERLRERPSTATAPPFAGTTAASEEPPTGAGAGSESADAPRQAALIPHHGIALTPSVTPSEPEPKRGETVYPDDPRFSPEARRAEAEKRVGERVQGHAQGLLGQARAQRGLPHPYFTAVRDGLRADLATSARKARFGPLAKPIFKDALDKLLGTAEQYGKTGQPDLDLGINPSQHEGMNQKFGHEMDVVEAGAWFDQVISAAAFGRPLLTLTVELKQTRDGTTSTVVLSPSRDPDFDAFVLASWGKALDEAGKPPEDSFRGLDEMSTTWAIDGWVALPPKLQRMAEQLPSFGSAGLSKLALPYLLNEKPRYDFRPRLLSVN